MVPATLLDHNTPSFTSPTLTLILSFITPHHNLIIMATIFEPKLRFTADDELGRRAYEAEQEAKQEYIEYYNDLLQQEFDEWTIVDISQSQSEIQSTNPTFESACDRAASNVMIIALASDRDSAARDLAASIMIPKPPPRKRNTQSVDEVEQSILVPKPPPRKHVTQSVDESTNVSYTAIAINSVLDAKDYLPSKHQVVHTVSSAVESTYTAATYATGYLKSFWS